MPDLESGDHDMKRLILPVLAVAVLLLGGVQSASAHCEVPCGIYADQMRFEQMLEDHETIAKAMKQIELMATRPDAQGRNQLVRWVNTKESHATNTMHVIAQYFMAQRIKPSSESYVKQLTAAHAVTLAAMKCKQTVDPKNADALKAAIVKLYEAYEGKPYGG
jgi:nickel superoxide dismutase